MPDELLRHDAAGSNPQPVQQGRGRLRHQPAQQLQVLAEQLLPSRGRRRRHRLHDTSLPDPCHCHPGPLLLHPEVN